MTAKNSGSPKGEMEIVLGDEVYVVRENDGFSFPSRTPHDWINRENEDAVVVCVITPPTF